MARCFGMVTTRASAAYTLPALDSFFQHTPWRQDDAFFLIDNDGGLDTGRLPAHVQVVVNPQPLAFAVNANQVIRWAALANADAFFLNNDIIFTPGWFPPVAADFPAVMTPTSNQNHQYQAGGLVIKTVMTLPDYIGREEQLAAVVAHHRTLHNGFVVPYKTNFFCVKVPPSVYRAVGLFDTRFGMAGGEDDDYCIRTYLRGFRVLVANESYLLHFGGRSTWSGAETLDQWRQREQNFIGVFQQKWGPTLSRFLLYRDPSVVSRDPSLQAVERDGGIAALFSEMARRDGVNTEAALRGPMLD